jgi:hypothetical protein
MRSSMLLMDDDRPGTTLSQCRSVPSFFRRWHCFLVLTKLRILSHHAPFIKNVSHLDSNRHQQIKLRKFNLCLGLSSSLVDWTLQFLSYCLFAGRSLIHSRGQSNLVLSLISAYMAYYTLNVWLAQLENLVQAEHLLHPISARLDHFGTTLRVA